MPQLDIYTYFTQFNWLLLIIVLLFLIINNQFFPTFQSLFEARHSISDQIEGSVKILKGLEYEKSTAYTVNNNAHSVVSKWDSIFDKHNRRNKSNVSNNRNK